MIFSSCEVAFDLFLTHVQHKRKRRRRRKEERKKLFDLFSLSSLSKTKVFLSLSSFHISHSRKDANKRLKGLAKEYSSAEKEEELFFFSTFEEEEVVSFWFRSSSSSSTRLQKFDKTDILGDM